MDVVNAKPQPTTTPEGGKKVASNRKEKIRHHTVRRFSPNSSSATTARVEPAAAFGDIDPPTL